MRNEKFKKIKNVDTIAFANFDEWAKENIKMCCGFVATIGCIYYTIRHWNKSLDKIDMFQHPDDTSKAYMKDLYDEILERSGTEK